MAPIPNVSTDAEGSLHMNSDGYQSILLGNAANDKEVELTLDNTNAWSQGANEFLFAPGGGGTPVAGFSFLDNASAPVLRVGTDGSISGSVVVDEDAMTSNSATKVPTQQSVKAYVDAISAGNGLTKTGSAFSINTAITADLSTAQTLANKTLTTPTIGSFANATHNHTNAAGGGQISPLTALTTTGTPSSSTYLRGDDSWATISAGGQTLYEAIVATSGGDYTTLSAAVTAGKKRIFVRNGTYTETGNITLLTDTVIIGESHKAIIDMTTSYNLDMGSGSTFTRNYIGNLTLKGGTGTNGIVQMKASYQVIDNVYFDLTSARPAVRMGNGSGTTRGNIIRDCIFDATSGAPSSVITADFGNNVEDFQVINNVAYGLFPVFLNFGNTPLLYSNISNNVIESTASSGAGNGMINIGSSSGNNNRVIGNMIKADSLSTAAVYLGTQLNIVANNTCYTTGYGVNIGGGNGNNIVMGNYFNTTNGVNLASSNNLVTGNTFANGTNQIVVAANNQTVTDNNFLTTTAPTLSTYTGLHIANNRGLRISEERYLAKYQNTSGGSVTAGQVVVWKATANGYEMTTTTTASDNSVLGVVDDATIANNAYGYIVTKGKVTTLKVNGTTAIAIGDFLTTYTAAGIAQKAVAGNLAFAIALEAYAVADSNGVLDALIIEPRRL